MISGVEQTISWDIAIENTDTPWIVVAVPDANMGEHKELFNATIKLREIK